MIVQSELTAGINCTLNTNVYIVLSELRDKLRSDIIRYKKNVQLTRMLAHTCTQGTEKPLRDLP